MQQKISMDLLICNSEDRISIDELVIALSSAYEKKAFASLLALMLSMIQEILIVRILSGKSSDTCCDAGHLTLNGHYMRRIRTSIGDVSLQLKKVICSQCLNVMQIYSTT